MENNAEIQSLAVMESWTEAQGKAENGGWLRNGWLSDRFAIYRHGSATVKYGAANWHTCQSGGRHVGRWLL